jgi:hypothetical protein
MESTPPWIAGFSNMRVLIDGYNLLHATDILGTKRGRKPLEHAQEALLVELANTLPPALREKTTIVFDAGPKAPRHAIALQQFRGIQVHFARRHEDADSLIVELIQQESAPKNLIVVSSDSRIQKMARRRRTQIWDSEKWLQALKRAVAPRTDEAASRQARMKSGETTPSPTEIQQWVEIFGNPSR